MWRGGVWHIAREPGSAAVGERAAAVRERCQIWSEGRTEKKVRVLTCPSSYRLSHFLLAMCTQNHFTLP
jgi:hypothetical protein